MTFHDFIFGGYPYLAGTIFLLGSWIRFDREQYTWKSDSSQLLSNKNMRLASNLFHVGILAVFFGHLIGLLTPHSWFLALGVSDVTHQYVALYLGTIFGSICLIGALMLFLRRINDPRIRAVSRTRDTFIIGWLLATVAIGLGTTVVSWGHAASGDTSTMIQLTPLGAKRGHPAAATRPAAGRPIDLQDPSVLRHDRLPDVSLYPSRTRLECTHHLSRARLPDCPCQAGDHELTFLQQ